MTNPAGAKKKKRKRNFEEVGHVRIPWCKLADGRTVVDPRKYGRKRETFTDHEEALLTARSIAIEINGGGVEIQAFTAADRGAYAVAAAAARKYGHDVSSMSAEWANARAAMGPTRRSLIEIVEAGKASLERQIHLLPDVAAELKVSIAPRDLHGRTKRSIESTCDALSARFPVDMRTITAKDLELWLDGKRDEKTGQLVGGLRMRNGDPIGTRRRDNILDEVRRLWTFARNREYLPDKIGEPQKIPHIHKLGAPISFFTVVEMRLILEHVSEDWLPVVVLNCFAGARIGELVLEKDAPKSKDPLRWEDIDFEEREIHVRAETAKGTGKNNAGRPRIMPLLDNAFEFLAKFKGATGPIAPKGKRPDREFGRNARLERAINAALQRAPLLETETPVQLHLEEIAPAPVPLLTSFNWRHNAFRHSYGSYRASILKNEHALADEMGNSVDMIRTHYRNPRPKSQARAYFGIFPKGLPANVTSIRAA